MITEEEIATLESIEAAIKSREEDYDRIGEYIQYADGGAYGQDLDRLRSLREEITELKKIKEVDYESR